MAAGRGAVLSLQECRALLGADCELTDSQIDSLRNDLYALANVALDALHEAGVKQETAMHKAFKRLGSARQDAPRKTP
jgi:hypothetical protein